jgi:uncharacterized protein (DUF2336 family)
MVVSHFLKWIEAARVSERAAAASALGRAYIDRDLPFEDRCAAEAALTMLLDDPSAKVRAALAEVLAHSPHAPLQVVSVLADDQPEVAAYVIARSPLLTDNDLIDRVAAAGCAVQRLIAARPVVSMALAAAICEVAEAEACAALVENGGASIAALSLRRLSERHGHVPRVRAALLADPRLPADCRHLLLVKLGEALRASPLVTRLIAPARAERLVNDACARSLVGLIERTPAAEHAALISHLRLGGHLTVGLLVRAVAHGAIDFFGAALVALGASSSERVSALLAGGGEIALAAAFRRAGLADALHPVLTRALRIWRDVATGRRLAGAQEVSWLMLETLGGDKAEGEIAALLKAIHLEALRDNARGHALAIAAA